MRSLLLALLLTGCCNHAPALRMVRKTVHKILVRSERDGGKITVTPALKTDLEKSIKLIDKAL